jgi:hypothetical protein
MDWPSQYHAILGRPAFSRFMAVPHYTYLVLMHELYSLLMHITTYLDVIIMFCIDLWGFSIVPLFWL